LTGNSSHHLFNTMPRGKRSLKTQALNASKGKSELPSPPRSPIAAPKPSDIDPKKKGNVKPPLSVAIPSSTGFQADEDNCPPPPNGEYPALLKMPTEFDAVETSKEDSVLSCYDADTDLSANTKLTDQVARSKHTDESGKQGVNFRIQTPPSTPRSVTQDSQQSHHIAPDFMHLASRFIDVVAALTSANRQTSQTCSKQGSTSDNRDSGPSSKDASDSKSDSEEGTRIRASRLGSKHVSERYDYAILLGIS
jgi:hypothetical protein